MLPTPTTAPHTNTQNTYSPSEDTHLLLDVLSSLSQTTYLTSRFPPATPAPLILEIGTGSGVILAFLAANARAIFGRGDGGMLTLGTDVNGFACGAAVRTVRGACGDVHGGGDGSGSGNGSEGGGGMATHLDILTADLASPLRPGTVDVLVFNPPYVPSESVPCLPIPQDQSATTTDIPPSKHTAHETFVRNNALLALATDGGADGIEVTERLLAQLPTLLSACGVAFVLFCARNKPSEVVERVRGWEGRGRWEASVVGDSGKMGGWERLCVVRIERVLC